MTVSSRRGKAYAPTVREIRELVTKHPHWTKGQYIRKLGASIHYFDEAVERDPELKAKIIANRKRYKIPLQLDAPTISNVETIGHDYKIMRTELWDNVRNKYSMEYQDLVEWMFWKMGATRTFDFDNKIILERGK